MADTTHLGALNLRLSHERARLAAAKSKRERDLRTVWISQIEHEISNEQKALGVSIATECEMTDDELLAALGA